MATTTTLPKPKGLMTAANSSVQPMLPPGGTSAPKPTAAPAPGSTAPQATSLPISDPSVTPPPPTTPDTSVAGKVKELTSQDSPLMQQARTDALKYANRRGLLNSSIAAGAAQESVIRAATPIASQDSSQEFQRGESALNRDLELKMQANSISLADRQQLRQIASTEGLAAAERALQERMQGKDITSREKLTLAQIQSTEGLAAAERALNERMQKAQLTAAQQQQIRDITSREGLAAAERALQTSMQQREIGYQTAERALDRGLQEKLASWNLAATDRNAAAQFLTNMESMYQQQYQSIMNNTALSADQRTAQLTSAKNLRDRQINFVEQMYDIDLVWGAPGTPGGPTPKPGAPGKTPAAKSKPLAYAAWLKTATRPSGKFAVPGVGDGWTTNAKHAYDVYTKQFKK